MNPIHSGSSATAVVALRSTEKVFAAGMTGIAATSLTVHSGEFVSIIGPSGCGKSTLLRLIARLIDASAGRIEWWGGGFEQVGAPGRRLAFVFQDPTLMPWATVAANVRLALELTRERDPDAPARIQAALAHVDLAACADAYPRQLSGGMRMRASIARALVIDPNLLLMDEPFAGLDEFARNRLDEDLLQLSHRRALTTVFVTHSIYEAVFLSTRVVVMAANPGRIFAEYLIDEPQPRSESFRLTDRATAHCRNLTALLNEASVASRKS